MGNIVGKPFGVVASIDYEAALKESVKKGNQAKFYLASQHDVSLDSIDPSDEFNTKRRNALIINGNTIQGISEEDSVKLDELSCVTKIFQYKGSVETGDDLKAKVPPEASVGDVWNVEKECEIDGVKYPAHTNFVCSSAKVDIDWKPGSSTWDSLGGAIQMGTYCEGKYTKKEVFFTQIDNIPISDFWLRLTSNSALEFDTSFSKPSLTLNLKEASVNSNQNIITYSNQTGSIMSQFSIKLGSGIYVPDVIDPQINLKLATYIDPAGNTETDTRRNCGLTFDKYGGIRIAISSFSYMDAYNISNSLTLVENENENYTIGGLAVNGEKVRLWLQNNIQFKEYINSIIDAKLKAQ